MIVVLSGGTGGAKLIQGLNLESSRQELLIICNTADDFTFHGLHISPDLDTVMYTLAGLVDTGKGWGLYHDSFVILDQLGKLGEETWFKIGDRDVATHFRRTRLLGEGLSLSKVTQEICRSIGIPPILVPMTDDRVATQIETVSGTLSFQEFFVKHRWKDQVQGVRIQGIAESHPAPGIVETIHQASRVIVCPSNPVTSIGPILAVPGIRKALRETKAPVAAVSPIIGNTSVSGPAHKLIKAIGAEASVAGVASLYADFLDLLVADPEDQGQKDRVEDLGIRFATFPIRMDTLVQKRNLANQLLALA